MLQMLDERSERLDRWVVEIGSPFVIELREEFQRNRVREEREWALTRTTISRSLRSSDRLEATASRLDHTIDRVERALDENAQALRALRDSLEGGNGPGPMV